MIAAMLTLLFLTAAALVGAATFMTVQQFGRQALGLRSQLAATPPTRALNFSVVEHRVIRGGINLVILPVQKCAKRLLSIEGLRAAA